MIKLDIDWLRKNCLNISYFGVIGVQLKIDKSNRLHFYTKELPAIVSEEDVHNHRYDFTSHILKGNFIQDIFEVTIGDKYLREQESCKEGMSCNSEGIPCDLKLVSNHTYSAGSKYFIFHDVFHRVKSEDCITLINRSEYKKELAEVIRPIGQDKICPFSKKVDEDVLWEIVNNMIQGGNLCHQ